MTRHSTWTPEQDAYLRTFWPDATYTLPILALYLTFSQPTISNRAKLLGLPPRKPGRRYGVKS